MKRKEMSEGQTKLSPPRGPRAAFFLFQEQVQEQIKEQLKQNGDANNGKSFNQALAAAWKDLRNNDERKEEFTRYQQMAAADQKRYNAEMAEYAKAKANPHDNGLKKYKNDEIDLDAFCKQFGIHLEDFKCAYCLDLLIAPVTLSCKHKFCMSCLKDDFNKRQGRSCRNSGDKIECILCKTKSSIDLNNVRPDPLMSSILTKIGGEEYKNKMNKVNRNMNIQILQKWYHPRNFGGRSELGNTINDLVHPLAEGFIAENQDKTFILNPGELIGLIQTSPFILGVIGFSMSDLAYYHLYIFMQSDVAARWRIYQFDNKTVMVNINHLIDNFIVADPQPELTDTPAELLNNIVLYCVLHERGYDRDSSNLVKLSAKINRYLPESHATFNYAAWVKVSRSMNQFIDDFFEEKYDEIVKNPENYVPFAEKLGIKILPKPASPEVEDEVLEEVD